MKLLGYIRVSTTKQAEGTSLETQKQIITDWCKLHGHELVHIFKDEGVSGRQGSLRPKYEDMLKRLVSDPEVNGVVVHSLSRLGRSLAEIISLVMGLQESGRTFVSVKENFDMTTKEGRMLFGVMAVINEYERELIRERMDEGRAYAELHGTRSGKPCHRPKKEINWNFVESCRKEKMSWNATAKALGTWHGQKVTTATLIKQARERGMKIE